MGKSGYSGIEWSGWDELLICGSSVRSRQGPLSQVLKTINCKFGQIYFFLFFLIYAYLVKKFSRLAFFIFPFVIFFVYQYLMFNGYDIFFVIKQEGVLDTLQFPIYLTIFALSISIFKNDLGLEGLFEILFSLGILFVALEEVSWGQFAFGYSIPEYFVFNNLQQETNVHNLGFIQNFTHVAYIAIGLLFSFGRILSNIHQLAPIIQKIIPHWKYIGFNLPLSIYYYLFFYTSYQKNIIDYVAQEYFEFMFSLGLLIFMFSSWRRQKVLT